jgi:CDP-diacylglycerol--glycerol-3-phosphate 3-phosphatidyltransferase
VLFIAAIATDGIDGHIARSRGLVTDLGKILDPIADKLLTSGALVCLSILGELPWWVTAIIVVREVGITIWRLVELRRGNVVPASSGGKLKTIVQSVAISFALVPLWLVFGEWIHWVNGVLMTAAVVLTLWSGLLYVRDAVVLARSSRPGR